ncbi:MAG: glycosyltransferase, partial [Candidatus Rokubacteria bacterium]|nr:glycosyltransferase [Candidatus Rokubacteria bacterium]
MNPLNILLVSGYPPGLHQYGTEKALRALGHTVFTVGASTTAMLQELEAAILQYDPGYRYDLIVAADEPLAAILARAPFEPDLLLYLESGIACLPPGIEEAPCPVVGLLTEDLLHAHWYSRIYPYFDLGLCTWKATEVAWRAQGYDHVRQWYYGARPAFSRDPGLPRIHDVAFLGNLNPRVQRKRLPAIQKILRLRDEGVSVYVGGGLFFEEYNRVYAQSKIVYHQGITDQVNMRVFEAMGAGCLVIMRRPQDPDDPSTRFFRDGEDVVYCDDDDQALDQIRYYLAHEDERRRIAAAGHRRVHAEHNYEDAVRRLFTDVLPALPEGLSAARGARLARFGTDERRRRLDYAWYYLSLGALEAADRQLVVLPDLAAD